MDFYTSAMRASHLLLPSAMGAFGGAIAAYFITGRVRKVVPKYRGLSAEDWVKMSMSNDMPTRVVGYEGLLVLEQGETLSTLFETEADEWAKFVCAIYLSKLGISHNATTEFLTQFLFERYGFCTIAEWEELTQCGLDLKNPKAYQRAQMLAEVRQRPNGTSKINVR
jgi:hypothetical protein